MRFLSVSLFLVFALTAVLPAVAGYQSYGIGVKSCGAWLQERKSRSVDWYQMGQWVLGYVTAYGYYGTNDLKKVDGYAMTAWIDNYCQQNPLEDIETAAQQLVESLKANVR